MLSYELKQKSYKPAWGVGGSESNLPGTPPCSPSQSPPRS